MESDFDFDADEPGPTGRKFRVVKPTERISTHSELFVFFFMENGTDLFFTNKMVKKMRNDIRLTL